MKTNIIQQNIVSNYKNLMSMIKKEPTEESSPKLYSLLYQKNGVKSCVAETGLISREPKYGADITIRITDGVCHIDKKPFYITTRYAYKKIDNMLRDMVKNFKTDYIQQSCLTFMTFSQELLKRLKI